MTNLVVCQACDASIYYCKLVGAAYTGQLASAATMVPAHEDIPQPKDGEDMLCPRCGELFAILVEEGSVVLKLADGAYWPYPPISALNKVRA